MEGRRINHSAPKRNPLYVMFLCLVAAVFVLLIVVIVLGAKLGTAQKAAKTAETQTEELQTQVEKLQEQVKTLEEEKAELEAEQDEKLDGEDTPAADPTESKASSTSTSSSSSKKVGWLDLTGHSEVSVLPEKVFDKYATYYTTAGVNLRSGPGTSYGKVQLVDLGTKVKAAAKDGNWTFVSVGSKFGWIRSDYLSTTPKAEGSSGSLLQVAQKN